MVLTPTELQQASGGTLTIPAAPTPVFDVFLVGGQSNTQNGEVFDPVLDAATGDIFQYGGIQVPGENNRVVLAYEPVASAGITGLPTKTGFPLTFAKLYKADNPGKKILIVSSAQGATGFVTGQWVPGGFNYDDFFRRSNAVMAAYPGSTIKALLWHQGESDAPFDTESEYANFVDSFFADVRSGVTGASASTPIVTGELADDFVQANPGQFGQTNDAIIDTPNRVSNCAFVSSTTPTILPTYDGTHFTSLAQNDFGQRYYDAYLTI